MITIRPSDPAYPAGLRRLRQPPRQLRLRGDLGRPLRRVALVGSRLTDEYGLEMAHDLASGLARAGVSVVSGGAEGVDSAAHRGALDGGGHTVAVLGGGFDHPFPAGNRELFERIAGGGGALVTEYDDDVRPARFTFPLRNRIIAGLSDAVVVVRAGARSGALITAEWARGLGIPLYAVPGDARSPHSAGAHALLRSGSRLAASAGDLLEGLGLAEEPLGQLSLPAADPAGLGADAAALFRALGPSPRHAGEVAREAGLPPGAALAALLDLELQGLCEQRPGNYFLRRR